MVLLAAFSQYFFGIVLFLISLFLILLVLIQRGRGGGLSGAFGGAGGQSAFGTKTGDVFTKITIVTATVWILTCALAVFTMKQTDIDLGNSSASNSSMGGENDSTSDSLGGSSLDGNGESSDFGGIGSSLDSLPNSDVGSSDTNRDGTEEPVAEVTDGDMLETPASESGDSESGDSESGDSESGDSESGNTEGGDELTNSQPADGQ